jgi:hypothetical protein
MVRFFFTGLDHGSGVPPAREELTEDALLPGKTHGVQPGEGTTTGSSPSVASASG